MEKLKSTIESETVLTELMIPSYANFGGKVHGGILLSLMDKVAYVTAAKHCSGYVVTVSVEGVEFLSPIEVGDLVSLNARVNYVGKTSMIVGIRVEALNARIKEESEKLADMERALKKLSDRKLSLEKDIQDYLQKMENAKNEAAKTATDLDNMKLQIDNQRQSIEKIKKEF
jgi:acyl-CoA hydrolase